MILLKKIRVFCLVSLLFFGCRKSTDANWDVDVVLPVVNSVLNVTNFVSDTLFSTDNTGLLHLVVNREVAAIKLDSLLSLPDTTIPKIPLLNVSPFSPTAYVGVPFNQFPASEQVFDIPNGVSLKRVDVREGSMTIKFTNNLTEPLDLIYKIQGATKNGTDLTITETIPTGTNSLVRTYDLSGYSIDMRGISGFKYNTIVQTYTVGLSTQATSSLVLKFGDGATLDVSYSKIVPDFVEGYFGQQVIDLPLDTARFGFSDNFTASNFMLSEATMNFDLLNEFGAEFSGNLSNIKSINTQSNKVESLGSNQLANVNINRATRAGTAISPSVKSFSFNSGNSNVVPFISNLPDKLTYQGKIKVNPLGNISGYNDFAFYNTGLRIIAHIDIPLKYTADYFELRNTTKVDFSNVAQLDKVNAGNLVILASNGYPFSVRLQAYMYDENSAILDSLFITGANTLDRGTVNFANEVISPTQKRILIPVGQNKIINLKRCKSIKVVSKFLMPTNPPAIKIQENYELKLNIIAELNYNVGLSN